MDGGLGNLSYFCSWIRKCLKNEKIANLPINGLVRIDFNGTGGERELRKALAATADFAGDDCSLPLL